MPETSSGGRVSVERSMVRDVPADPSVRVLRPVGSTAAPQLSVHRSRRPLPVPERWAVVTVLVCAAAFAVLTALIAVPGPVRDFDWWVWGQGFEWRYPGKPVMEALTVLGQRGPTLVVVLLVVAAISRRVGSWRPVAVLAGSQLLLNGVVGSLKYGLGRAKAETGSAELFAGGTMYPSGHSSNTVVVFGVLAYLLVAYGGVRRRRLVAGLAAVPALVVATASIFIGSHWVTDIVAGWLVGTAILALTVTLDRRWPGPRPEAVSPAPKPAPWPVPSSGWR